MTRFDHWEQYVLSYWHSMQQQRCSCLHYFINCLNTSMYQLNFGFSLIGSSCLYLCVSHWLGIVAGWHSASVSLYAIMITVAARMTA